MSNVFGNKNIPGMQATDGEENGEEMNIYSNVDDIKSHDVCRGTKDTTRNQTSQHTGSECVKNRSPRSVLVCLVVLCVLLLTAVIVLCVLIYTNNHQFNINNKNITQERDRLLTNNTKLTEERDRLLTNNTKLTEERDRLLTNNTKLIEERDQLLTKKINVTEEKNELRAMYNNITKCYKQLNQKTAELQKHICDGCIYYQSSLYFISSEKKSWSESRSHCRKRGADLAIINNKEEQDFIKNIASLETIWIGLSDSEVEGKWKWVDGSTLTISFWGTVEPNGQTKENCVESHSTGWNDQSCNKALKCICEKKIT